MSIPLTDLLKQVRACTLCEPHLPQGPRPIVQLSNSARILIAAQAPGTKVHATGIPFNDPSGDRLRAWLGISSEVFYDARQVALLPMGFCYPGKGKSGDLPPRKECAAAWRDALMSQLQQVKLTLVIGQYALAWHLGDQVAGQTLTATVQQWRSFGPAMLPLPHPSPRNNIWLRRNPWFEAEVLPDLQQRVRTLLHG